MRGPATCPQLAGEVHVAPVVLDGKSAGLRLDGIVRTDHWPRSACEAAT